MRLSIAVAAAAFMLAGPVLAAAPPAGPPPPGYIARNAPPPAKGAAPGMKMTEYGPAMTHAYKVNFVAGDELVSGMTEVAETLKLKQATLTGVGGFISAVLSWYDPAVGHFKRIEIDQKCEVTSFVGTISTDAQGRSTFHAHVALAMSDGSTKSGHLVSAQINPIMEVYITDLGEGRPLAR